MANWMRRILALSVALALCAGQIAVPAMAAEQETTVNVTVTPIENGAVIETTTESGDGTVTQSIQTIVQTAAEVLGGVVTTVKETVSEVTTQLQTGEIVGTLESVGETSLADILLDRGADGTDDITRKEWQSTTTEETIRGAEGENPSVQVTEQTVTEVAGSELTVENTVIEGDTQITTGSIQGQEDTRIEKTTTTTTTTGDVLITEEQITDEPIVETVPTENTAQDKTEENDGWELGEATDTDWDTSGQLEQGEETTPVSEDSATTGIVLDELGQSVLLELLPNGETVLKEFGITLEDVSDGTYTDPYTGEAYTVEKVYEDGKLVGWKVTNKSTEDTQYWKTGDAVDPATGEAPQWTQTGETSTRVVEPENYAEGEKQLDDNTVQTTVKVTDPDTGEFLYYEVTTVTTTTAYTEGQAESDRESTTVTALQKPENTTTTGENGETIVVTVEDLVENGEVVGYTTTTVITDSEGNHISTVTDNVYGTPAVEDTFTLPEKPEQSIEVTEDGRVVAVIVEEILEDGKLVGYTSTALTYEDGEVVYTESRSIYGTTSSTSTVTVTDPETEKKVTTTNTTVTTVEKVYATESVRDMVLDQEKTDYYNTTITTVTDEYLLENTKDGKLVFTYQGVMYEVMGSNTIVENLDVATNGTVPMTGLTIENDMRTSADYSTHYTGQMLGAGDSNQNGIWTHVGYGQYSTFVLRDSNEVSHSVKQFAIKDGKTIRYVYCVELGTSISAGTYYTPEEHTGNTESETPWEGASGNIAQLRSVALNGYWGTESGLGSLEAVKDLMIRNGYEEEAENLTEGMALAATQAAIWEYGAPEGVTFTGDYITYDDSVNAAPTEKDAATIKALRDLLVKLAEDPNGAGVAEAITPEKSIAGATINVHNRVTDEDGNVQTDSSGNTLYNTDLSFRMAVSTSSINGDLVLEITNENGDSIGQYRLAGDDSTSDFDGTYEKIYPDPDTGIYTIENLVLAENVAITLNLDGVQHLDDGVYIYEGVNNMQDFIGLSMKENQVDLSVSLEFSVEDPVLVHTHTVAADNRVDTQVSTKYDTRTDTKVTTLTCTDTTTVTNNSHNIKVYGTVTATETKRDVTKEHKEWQAYWKYLTDLSEEEGEGGSDGVQEGSLRSDAPKTGDVCDLLTTVSMLSLAGVVLLRKKRK